MGSLLTMDPTLHYKMSLRSHIYLNRADVGGAEHTVVMIGCEHRDGCKKLSGNGGRVEHFSR